MDQKLWDVIKLFSGKKEVGPAEMAIARESLDPDVFAVFKEHMEKAISLHINPWI